MTAARKLVNGGAQCKKQMLGLEQRLVGDMFPSPSFHRIFPFWKMEYVHFLGTKSLRNNYKCSSFFRIYMGIYVRCLSRTQMWHWSDKGKKLCWMEIKSNNIRNKEKCFILRKRVGRKTIPLRVASICLSNVHIWNKQIYVPYATMWTSKWLWWSGVLHFNTYLGMFVYLCFSCVPLTFMQNGHIRLSGFLQSIQVCLY